MNVHFIAIGGSAMHNLAIALKLVGYNITGSDDEIFEPSRSRLNNHGILPAHIGWFPEKIHHGLDAIILGMHARADNPELLRAQELGLRIFSYPEYLYEQSKDKVRIVIGGSHGKTTITAMVLHVLAQCGVEADYMVGAQLDGFDVMVRLSDTAKFMVMEGDEYLTSPIDRRPKFLLYRPHIAVISGIAWDHINVFPTLENYIHQFELFTEVIEPHGHLIYYQGDDAVNKVAAAFIGNITAYGIHPYEITEGKLLISDLDGNKVPLHVFGEHNLANLNAARLVCLEMGVKANDFYRAISSFKGASRRLEFVGEQNGSLVYRDFAHAPSKVRASVAALRLQYPKNHLAACLELHTFSSLNETFIGQYKGSLDAADVAVVFYDPHAVALKRLPALKPEQILEAFDHPNLFVFSDVTKLQQFLASDSCKGRVLALMSSGSFKGLSIKAI